MHGTAKQVDLLSLRRSDPHLRTYLKEISGRAELDFDGLLKQAVWSEGTVEGLRAAYELMFEDTSLDVSWRLAGGIAFFLLTVEAEREHSDRKERLEKYLSREETRNFILEYYGLAAEARARKLEIRDFRFLENGTTSLIFSCLIYSEDVDWQGHLVFKLIKPRYWASDRIAEATKNFKSRYLALDKYCPKIIATDQLNGRWVVMRRVIGSTLRAYAKDFLHDTQTSFSGPVLDAARLERVKCILEKLCDALAYFAISDIRIPHEDLSPRNIMVTHDLAGEIDELYVIDFGRNYAALEQTSHPDQRADVKIFVAPEYRGPGLVEASFAADFYSLGFVALELLSRHPLDSIPLVETMSQLWLEMPGMAQIIDDLTEEDASLRLALLPPPKAGQRIDWSQSYCFLKQAFRAELEIHRATLVDERASAHMPFLDKLKIVPELLLSRHTRKRLDAARHHLHLHGLDDTLQGQAVIELGPYATQTIRLLYGVVIIAAVMTLIEGMIRYDLPFPLLDDWVDFFRHSKVAGLLPYELGEDFWGNSFRRLTVLFSATASARFYLNICGLLRCHELTQLGRRTPAAWLPTLARWVNNLMWINSFWFIVPCFLAIVVSPHDWPGLTSTGYFLAALNLWLMRRLIDVTLKTAIWADNASASVGGRLSRPPLKIINRFVDTFRSWWFYMLLVGLFLFAIQVLMWFGGAHDEYVYVVLYCGAVVSMLYWNCGTMAPEIRGGLDRIFSALYRADRRGLLSQTGGS